MTTAEIRLAAARRLERALDALNNGASDCDDQALAQAEEAARLLDKLASEPRAEFGRQAAHYVALWLTNGETAWDQWQDTSAQQAREIITERAYELASKISARAMSALDSALAELLTRAVAWLDYEELARQLSSD